MDVKKIAQYDDNKGLLPRDAVLEANKLRLPLLNNLGFDERLVKTELWKQEKEVYPAWTGTLIAYEEAGKPLKETVEFQGLTFKVPKLFQGKKDAAIVCDHPDFTWDAQNIINMGKSAKCIPFPQSDGWYLPEPAFGVPNGAESGEGTAAARYLVRRDDEAFTGLLARDYDGWDGYLRRDVYAYGDPRLRCGVFGVRGTGKFNLPKCKHQWTCSLCGATR